MIDVVIYVNEIISEFKCFAGILQNIKNRANKLKINQHVMDN